MTVAANPPSNQTVRKLALLGLAVASILVACASTDATTTPSDDAGTTSDASTTKKDGSSGSDADTVADTSTSDAGGTDAKAKDSASDVTTTDAPAEAATDAASEGGADAAGDSATDSGDGGCVPPNGNFAFCGTATATSVYSGYPASAANDGDVGTSWYAASGACPSGACPTDTIRVDIALDAPQTIARVKLFGNRDFPTGYDTLTARIQLLDGTGGVLASDDVTTSRGNEPNGDVDHAFTSAVAGVHTVRVIVLTTEGDDPGIGEIEAYAN